MNYDTSDSTCDPKLEVRKPEKIHWKVVMVIAQELLKTVALKLQILRCYYHSSGLYVWLYDGWFQALQALNWRMNNLEQYV
jgi:hypothetical protein